MIAGCSAKGDPTETEQPIALAADGAMWGTDTHMPPGQPSAIMRYADHARGYAALRLPQGDGPFPLAVLFHGGCWKAGLADTAYLAPLATRWQQQGIATLNVDYREVGEGKFGGGGWPNSFTDWQQAAGLIDQLLANYPIDRNRITLVGHSAGALPALWLTEQRGTTSPGGGAVPVKARAAIIFDGPADIGAEREAFDALCEFSAVDPFMGGSPDAVAGRYAAISPGEHPPQLKEILFVNARLPQPPKSALDAVGAGGAKVETLSNSGASHFDIITPGAEAYTANEPAIMKVLRGE
ncbi:alpha/beta fold hydrolase [Erythrobacter sp. LQ02-29]|uniref:alpha/beta hydrolase family protein n=1 Tax=Erythrobacter sp. LQ02-29 TaxID=2920384 RepID=UPI001F4E35A7|nr:alpha/beta fold hydrolase [Erythrobacter sp. LQ02-29]MCP9223012.1 alpha/beta fold hydrolase [Erythrobacter sp. LQ02-29]